MTRVKFLPGWSDYGIASLRNNHVSVHQHKAAEDRQPSVETAANGIRVFFEEVWYSVVLTLAASLAGKLERVACLLLGDGRLVCHVCQYLYTIIKVFLVRKESIP